MAYRGRLIRPLQVDIARVDTNATRVAGNYDTTFRTMKPGTTRTELATVRLFAQVEMGRWEGQNQTKAGNVPDSRLTLIFHFKELEAKSLVDASTGDALIRVNDRLVAIWTRDGSKKVMTAKVPNGGLYATEVQPGGLGLGGDRNLLIAVFEDRPKGLTSNP